MLLSPNRSIAIVPTAVLPLDFDLSRSSLSYTSGTPRLHPAAPSSLLIGWVLVRSFLLLGFRWAFPVCWVPARPFPFAVPGEPSSNSNERFANTRAGFLSCSLTLEQDFVLDIRIVSRPSYLGIFSKGFPPRNVLNQLPVGTAWSKPVVPLGRDGVNLGLLRDCALRKLRIGAAIG
jgi:hypothetical protein